jgi:hypothetical protein
LETARRDAGLSVDELWVRYLGNGGTATPADFRHFLAGHHWPGALQYDIAVSALNDRFTEMNLNHPIPYSDVFAGRAAADWP